MDMWTEIMGETVATLHVEADGKTQYIVVPIADDVPQSDALHAMQILEWRLSKKVWQEQKDQFREMSEQIQKRQEARERLERAGYPPGEVPF